MNTWFLLSVCLNIVLILYLCFTSNIIQKYKKFIEKRKELKQLKNAVANAVIPNDVTQLMLTSKHFVKIKKPQ